jgi:hypothetical protein
MKITTINSKNFQQALGFLTRVQGNTQARIAAIMEYAVSQLQNGNRNTKPLSDIVGVMSLIPCKPKGFNTKNLKAFATENGLEWNSKKAVFTVDKKSESSKNEFVGIKSAFWKDLPEPVKATPKTTAEKLAILLKDVEIDDALKMLETHYDAQFTIIDDDATVELQAA